MPGSSSVWWVAVTDRRIGFFWPLGARVFLVAGVLLFGVTLLRTWEALSWSYQEWSYTNGLFEGFALALTGPIAAAFGAFLSGRLTPPSRLYALPRFSRDTVQFLAQSLAPAVLVVTSAYLLALVPVVVQTYRTATAGSLDPVNAASGVLVLNTLLVTGWLIGLFAQSAFAAPVAFGAAFAATLVGYGVNTWNAVTPVTADMGVVGVVETQALKTFRLSFFFVVLVVALLTAGAVLTSRGFERRLPPVRVAALWLLPAAFLVVGIGQPPAAVVRETGPPRICRDVNGMEFCMHRAHEKDLDALVEEVAPIIAVVGKENLPFDRIHDWSLSDGSIPPKDPTVFYADASPKYGVVGARDLIANQVSGTDVCAARPGRQESEQGFNSFMLSVRLNGDREDRPDNRFGPLSDDQLRQWLAEHRSQVNSCDITNDLLP
jgi:hypothetical protein